MKRLKDQGYTVINTKNSKFVTNDGYESDESYTTYIGKEGANEILEDIDWYIGNHDNKHSRNVKKRRKYFKVVKLILFYE